MYRLSSTDYQKLAEKFDGYGNYKIADYYDSQLRLAQELSPEIEKALERQEARKKTTRQKVFDAGFGALEASSVSGAKKGIKSAYDLVNKAKANPAAAQKAGWLANWITTKVPKLAFLAKSLPFLGVLIHIAFSYPVVMDYINKIQQGKFEKEIWSDPTERATFIEQCMMLIAGFLMAPPANTIPGFAAAGTGPRVGGRFPAVQRQHRRATLVLPSLERGAGSDAGRGLGLGELRRQLPAHVWRRAHGCGHRLGGWQRAFSWPHAHQPPVGGPGPAPALARQL
jgi:hypothetical protein